MSFEINHSMFMGEFKKKELLSSSSIEMWMWNVAFSENGWVFICEWVMCRFSMPNWLFPLRCINSEIYKIINSFKLEKKTLTDFVFFDGASCKLQLSRCQVGKQVLKRNIFFTMKQNLTWIVKLIDKCVKYDKCYWHCSARECRIEMVAMRTGLTFRRDQEARRKYSSEQESFDCALPWSAFEAFLACHTTTEYSIESSIWEKAEGWLRSIWTIGHGRRFNRFEGITHCPTCSFVWYMRTINMRGFSIFALVSTDTIRLSITNNCTYFF